MVKLVRKKQEKEEVIEKKEEKSKDPKDLPIGTQIPISGRVYSTSGGFNGEIKKIRVFAPKSKKIINTTCNFFCPAEVQDAIIGLVEHQGCGIFNFVSPPMVEVAADKNSIVLFISKALKGKGAMNEYKAGKLYDKVVSLCDDDMTSTVINWFNEKSIEYVKSELDLNYSNEVGISPSYIEQGYFLTLLGEWHQKRVIRQLYLLGLNNKEIQAACYLQDIDIEKLYTKCRDNPNSVCSISANTVSNIIARTLRFPTKEQKECGIISRHIYYNLIKRKYNCTDSWAVNRLFKTNDKQYWKQYISVLEKDYDVVYDRKYEKLYLKKAYMIESIVAETFLKMLESDPLVQYYGINDEFPEVNTEGTFVIDDKFYSYNREEFLVEDTRMVKEQIAAIQGALDHKICIITGSAGSGKSTTVNSIVKCLKHRDFTFYLCSFTGKAVSRIKEVVEDVPAYTIHRLISHINDLGKNATNTQYLVVDEASMVPLPLFYELISTIKDCYGENNMPRMIFIGDNNQLPPIDWGSMFLEMIASKRIPTYILLHNHRVDNNPDDGIVINATSMINNLYDNPGVAYNFAFAPNFIINDASIDALYAYIEILYEEGVDKEDFRVISPYKKDLEKINKKVQEIYNFNREFVKDEEGKKWYIGDIVVMCHNNYDIDVMNGEQGVVVKVNDTHISVRFGEIHSNNSSRVNVENNGENTENNTEEQKLDSRIKVADFALIPPRVGRYANKRFTYMKVMTNDEVRDDKEVSEHLTVKHLKHAYCTTVHKSQGSEWKRVVFWIPYDENTNASSSFFNCNLTYTAITRAKESVLIIGNTDTFVESTKFGLAFRNNKLKDRLQENKDLPVIEKISFKDQFVDTSKLPKMFISDAEIYGFDEEDDYPF